MIQCPLCKKHALRLKTRSHIIPRFAMTSTKENGCFTEIHGSLKTKKYTHQKRTADLVSEIVCTACEIRFSEDDRFGARFFKRSEFLKRNRPKFSNGQYYADYDPNASIPLLKFVVSLFLRFEYHLVQNKQDSLFGSRLLDFEEKYIADELSFDGLGLYIVRNTDIGAVHSNPYRRTGLGRPLIEILFHGYTIVLLLENSVRTLDAAFELITTEQLVVTVDPTRTNSFLEPLRIAHEEVRRSIKLDTN